MADEKEEQPERVQIPERPSANVTQILRRKPPPRPKPLGGTVTQKRVPKKPQIIKKPGG